MTPKQQRFVEEYPKDLNATQAAIRAGYSKKTAYSIGEENLKKPEIREAIANAIEARSKKAGIDSDWVLKRLATEVEADIADLYTEAGSLKPVSEWPLVWRQGLVAGVEVEQLYAYEGGDQVPSGVVTKVKLSDRVKRIEMIGRHTDVQAWRDNVNLSMNEVVKKDWRGNDRG